MVSNFWQLKVLNGEQVTLGILIQYSILRANSENNALASEDVRKTVFPLEVIDYANLNIWHVINYDKFMCQVKIPPDDFICNTIGCIG